MNKFDLGKLNLRTPFGAVLMLFTLILSGCQNIGKFGSPDRDSTSSARSLGESKSYICRDAHHWRGQVVGDGHCVSFIKRCSGAPLTHLWRPGSHVKGIELEPGTIIATFVGQRYPSKSGYHAAIYSHQDNDGIWVWDQWRGKPVHLRLIKWQNPRSRPANSGKAYRVVLTDIAP